MNFASKHYWHSVSKPQAVVALGSKSCRIKNRLIGPSCHSERCYSSQDEKHTSLEL